MQGYGCSPHQAESIHTVELTSSYPGLVYGIGSQKCFLQPALSPKEPVLVCLLMAPHCKGTQWTTDLDQAPPRIQNPPHSSLTKKHQGSVRQLKASGVRARVYRAGFPGTHRWTIFQFGFLFFPGAHLPPSCWYFPGTMERKPQVGDISCHRRYKDPFLFSGFSEVN